jgi:hypothetical protein
MRVQMRFDSETTCERAAKAIRQKVLDNARGSFAVDGRQEG